MSSKKIRKVFFVTTFLSGKGGMETVIKTACKELNKRNIEVKIILLGKYKSHKNDISWLQGMDFKPLLPHFPFRKFFRSYFEIRRMVKIIREEKPDALIGLNNSAISCLFEARKRTDPFPIFSWVHFSLKILRKFGTLKKADFHLSISSGITRELVSLLSIPPDRVFTVFNPVPFSSHIERVGRPRDSKTTFLFMGRLADQKDPFFLLETVRKLKGDWQLHILGDGPLRQQLKELIKIYELEGRVLLHGWKSNPWTYIQSLDGITALILTSKNEGFPMVLLESMAHGVYCISSDCETGPEDIITGDNGELFEVGNAEDLLKKLQIIVDTSGAHLPSQDRICRSIKRFSTESYCDNFLSSIKKAKEVFDASD